MKALEIAATAALLATLSFSALGREAVPVRLPLRSDGTIPSWYVAGPFEQPTAGFGTPVDTDIIGEASAEPFEGKPERSTMCVGGTTHWHSQSVDEQGYLDFARTIGWAVPGENPEKVWVAKVGYAFTQIETASDQDVVLLLGSNSSLRVFLNGAAVHSFLGDRGAVRDQDTVRLHLRQGRNALLLKVGNTHQNHWLNFFGGTPWGWGAYARLVQPGGAPLSGLDVLMEGTRAEPGLSVTSTFFYKNSAKGLLQRFDLILDSPWPDVRHGTLRLTSQERVTTIDLPGIRFGRNRVEMFLPAPARNQPVTCSLSAGGAPITAQDTLRPERKYELHLMFLTHTDIGYTHIQPVVKELHLRALDNAVAMCRKDPEFRWTIETVWQLQQYERARSKSAMQEVMRLIREGRIAVSPFLTNPSTGWVSEEEMIRALAEAGEYKAHYKISYDGAVYNDTPGLAWFVPQVLKSVGVSMIACGLNEVYEGYPLQKSLPKAFSWEGADGSKVIVYRCETYNEGAAYGLERGGLAIEQRMWERLHRLRSRGDDREMVLLDAAWMDNGDVAAGQYAEAKKWNATYAYPRFIFTTIAQFAREFARRYHNELPILRGDWTSAWDIRNQGEPSRSIRERWAQQQVLTAEGLDAVQSLRHPAQPPLREVTKGIYESLLEYSGHGSGLEYGYGTPSENALSMDYREQDVRSAFLGTRELLSRARFRLVRPEEEFQREGIIVWNPLSWKCDAPLDIELKDSSDTQCELTDLVTGRVVPSYRAGHHLYFVAPALPPLGYKKFGLRQVAGLISRGDTAGLSLSQGGVFANRFYQIRMDVGSGRIMSITDRMTGRELIDSSRQWFTGPIVHRGFTGTDYSPVLVGGERAATVILDQRPVRLVVSIRRQGQLFEQTDYTLWNGVNRIDVTHHVCLNRLQPPAEVENYAVGFPFAFRLPRVEMEVLGGYLTVGKDRLPGALQDGFSVRRSVALSDGRYSLAWSTVDCRVVYWQNDSTGRQPFLLANVVNNFPRGWNRNEENEGVWTYRFSFTGYQGDIDFEKTARLGWEAMTEFPASYTWLRALPAETSFVSVTGKNVILAALKPSDRGEAIVLRLMNVSPDSGATGSVSSPLFPSMDAYEANVFEEAQHAVPSKNGAWEVHLKPSETRTLMLRSSQAK